MNSLAPDQAQALYQAGGFIVLSLLPEGSEFGIDGTWVSSLDFAKLVHAPPADRLKDRFHLTRQFLGLKLLPPGLHLVTFSASSASSSSAGGSGSGPPPAGAATAAAIPIRSGILRYFERKERYFLAYDAATEHLTPDPSTLITDDQLRARDAQLAPYPFTGLHRWQALTSAISRDLLRSVLGPGGRVDGMRGVAGEEDEAGRLAGSLEGDGAEAGMAFVRFDLRRSWRDGAVGDEVTRFARDKSWLLGKVVQDAGGDPAILLGQAQLAFILLLYLSSYAALTVYKRLVSLFCRSSSALASASTKLQSTYAAWVDTLARQLDALPDQVFEGDLPEMDLFYLDELESLRVNLGRGIPSWGEKHRGTVVDAWSRLKSTAKNKFHWDLSDLAEPQGETDDEEEEDGEYAPVIVDT